MDHSDRLLLGGVLLALTWSLFKRAFPYTLHIQWSEVHGWRCWIERE